MPPEMVAFLISWAWEPAIVGGLAAAGVLYAFGWRTLGRQTRGKVVLERWRSWAYAGGLALVALALLSPVAVFSELLFTMHMLQHVLLMAAAPLILLGSPLLPVLWALPRALRRAIGGLFVPAGPLHAAFHALTNPFVAATLYVSTVALWHAPSFYDAAQGRTLVHDLEHVMFLGTALLYWWPVVHPGGGKRRLGFGLGILYLTPALLSQNVIGMVLTFADRPLYATYQHVPRLWGISVVLDQQLAGAVMGITGAAINLVAMTVLLVLFLRSEERRSAVTGSNGGT